MSCLTNAVHALDLAADAFTRLPHCELRRVACQHFAATLRRLIVIPCDMTRTELNELTEREPGEVVAIALDAAAVELAVALEHYRELTVHHRYVIGEALAFAQEAAALEPIAAA